MNSQASKLALPLEKALHWEKAKAGEIYFTQPMGNGQIAEFTWQRAVGEARRMASYIKSLDLPPKSNIGILSKNCAHWIMTDLAIWMAGHVSVPLYPTLNGETVAYILEHSEAKLLFVGKLDDWETMKSGVPADLKCISYPLSPKTDYETWDDIVAKHSPLQDVAVRVPEELATIVYTSGSTGKPKGVMLSFFNMAYSAEGVVDALNISTDERMLSYLPLSHVFERFVVEMGSLYRGFHLFFAESLDTFVQDLNRAQPTLFLAVPRIWTKFQSGIFKKMPKEKMDKLMRIPLVNRLIKKKVIKGLGLQNVKFAGSGSAPLSDEIMGWYRQLGLELLEGYGMSENFAYSHMTKPGRSRIGYVGEALPGVEVRISEEGEVQVKSPATMMGYYKEPEKTAETMTADGFLKTGDKGTIDEMGRLKLTGRIKEIFKTSKGKYVAPAPIENRITAHPHIEMVCVAGSEYPQPHALIMLSEDAQARKVDEAFRKELEASFVNLLKEVNASLDPHEHLQFFTVVEQEWSIENNFLTPTMKMKRNVIEDAYKAMLDDWYGRRQPVIWQ
jgi:long-subunit acyl-CoA synthetase (AMP-forming)